MNIYMIIPCYNVEKDIYKCIDSIKKQTDLDFFTVFVDDGSNDNTKDLIEKNISGNLKMSLVHQDNNGVSSARNRGLKYVFKNYSIKSDDYITFMDPDDIIESTLIEELRKVLSKKSVDAVYFGYHWHEENVYRVVIPYKHKEICDNNLKVINNVIPLFIGVSKKHILTYKETGQLTVKKEMGSVWRFFYRANIIKDYNIFFDTDVVRGEDLLFNLKFLCKAESVITYDKALYHYYVKKEGAMYKKFTDMDKLLSDKLGTLRVRDSIRAEIMNKYHIDILDWYMGSTAISIIGLAVNLAGSNLSVKKQYRLLTKYIETGSVKESRNRVLRMKIPVKWRIPLILSQKWLRSILLILLGILQKVGFKSFKILN